MKIETTKERLIEAISKAEKITGKNLTLPVLGCILFEAAGRDLIIRSTNLDLGIEITIPVKVQEQGKVAVPGNIIHSFISNIPNGSSITIEVIENNVKITTPTNKTVIKSLPFEDFPTIPILSDEKKVKLNAKDFVKGIKAVWYSSAVSSMKPELSSVYVYSNDEGLTFVATDSFRLAEKKIKTKESQEFGTILIPVKNIPEILRVLEVHEGDIEISLNKNQIAFTYNGVYLTSRVVDGVFPDYKQIIPKEHKTHVVVLKHDLVGAFKLATIFSDKFNKLSIKAHPSEKLFELSTRNADVGENSNTLEVVSEGEDVDINFNYKYITDCFQSIDSDSVALEFAGLTRPLVMRGVNDKSFMYLVMPINK